MKTSSQLHLSNECLIKYDLTKTSILKHWIQKTENLIGNVSGISFLSRLGNKNTNER